MTREKEDAIVTQLLLKLESGQMGTYRNKYQLKSPIF